MKSAWIPGFDDFEEELAEIGPRIELARSTRLTARRAVANIARPAYDINFDRLSAIRPDRLALAVWEIALVVGALLALEAVVVVQRDLAVRRTDESEATHPVEAEALVCQLARGVVSDTQGRPAASGRPAVLPEDGLALCTESTLLAKTHLALREGAGSRELHCRLFEAPGPTNLSNTCSAHRSALDTQRSRRSSLP